MTADEMLKILIGVFVTQLVATLLQMQYMKAKLEQVFDMVKEVKDQSKECEHERKRYEDELFNKINKATQDIAVLQQQRTSRGGNYIE